MLLNNTADNDVNTASEPATPIFSDINDSLSVVQSNESITESESNISDGKTKTIALEKSVSNKSEGSKNSSLDGNVKKFGESRESRQSRQSNTANNKEQEQYRQKEKDPTNSDDVEFDSELTQTKAFSQALKRMNERNINKLKKELKEELINNNPAVKAAIEVINKNQLKSDLNEVKAAFPNVSANDATQLGEIYVKLMATDLFDPVTAYTAQLAYEQNENNKKIPTPGELKSSNNTTQDYFTPQEAQKLTRGDFRRDPGLMQRVRQSMSKWK